MVMRATLERREDSEIDGLLQLLAAKDDTRPVPYMESGDVTDYRSINKTRQDKRIASSPSPFPLSFNPPGSSKALMSG